MLKIRVDDFPNTKDNEKDKHSLAAFREFDRCLRECIGGKRYLLGVIPKRCDPDDILFLRNETDCEIGMHGIYHDEGKLDIYQNEFPPYLSQRDVCRYLQETAEALDNAIGRRTEIYMPPRNRIDQRTLDVLVDAGFLAYTGGPETAVNLRRGSYDSHDAHPPIYYHSEPPYEYGRTDEMLARGAPEYLLQRVLEGKQVILTLHWTWETNIGLEHMRKFFARIPKEHLEDFL